MTKLFIMRGVSGSGKSTRARQIANARNAMIVSRDDIRKGLFNTEFDPAIEDRVTIAEHALIESYLKSGIDVISDNTNVEMKYVKALAKIANRLNVDVEIIVIDEPLGTCKYRNANRAADGGRFVPMEVIEKQHSRFQGTKNLELAPVPELIPYTGTPGKPEAFLVDIDGTLAHMRDRRGPFDWKKVGLDDVDVVVSEIVIAMWYDYEVIVMSGRDAVCRPETEGWLNKHDIPWNELFMRPERDMRPDNIVKHELFNTYVRDNYDVRFVLDDRQQVVDMWRRMGIACLQVAPGDF